MTDPVALTLFAVAVAFLVGLVVGNGDLAVTEPESFPDELKLAPCGDGWLVVYPDGEELVVEDDHLDAVLSGWRGVQAMPETEAIA